MTDREKAIELLQKYKEESEEDYYVRRAKALDMAIEALEQEPCEDAISRQAVEDTIINYRWKYSALYKSIKQLPSVTPHQKMGHWEWNQYDANPKIGNFHCSLCHSIGRTYFDYCPYCGAKMEVIPTGAEGSEE